MLGENHSDWLVLCVHRPLLKGAGDSIRGMDMWIDRFTRWLQTPLHFF